MGVRAGCGVLLAALVVAATAAPVEAHWVATPYVGMNVGDVENGKGGIGISAGYIGDLVGFELELERHWHFFKDGEVVHLVPDPRIDLDTRATSLMGNVIVPIRIPDATSLLPYGT